MKKGSFSRDIAMTGLMFFLLGLIVSVWNYHVGVGIAFIGLLVFGIFGLAARGRKERPSNQDQLVARAEMNINYMDTGGRAMVTMLFLENPRTKARSVRVLHSDGDSIAKVYETKFRRCWVEWTDYGGALPTMIYGIDKGACPVVPVGTPLPLPMSHQQKKEPAPKKEPVVTGNVVEFQPKGEPKE